MYVIWVVCTQPGTEINVTPDIEDPNIPIATIYHLDLRLPRKKPSLFVFFPVKSDITIRIEKYPRTIANINRGFI